MNELYLVVQHTDGGPDEPVGASISQWLAERTVNERTQAEPVCDICMVRHTTFRVVIVPQLRWTAQAQA